MRDDRMSDTELEVVCRECGAEVSPYVTECPYCGARVRKRAPRLAYDDDHFEPLPSSGRRLRLPRLGLGRLLQRRRRARAERAGSAQAATTGVASLAGTGFVAPALVVLGSALLMLIRVAGDLSLYQVGAVAGEVQEDWWRYLAAPFAYDNVGYLFVVGVAVAIFGSGLERRLGSPATLILLLGCGVLGALGGYGAEVAISGDATGLLIAGGNAIALGAVLAWLPLRRAEERRMYAGDRQPLMAGYDAVGVGVVVMVLLMLPLVERSADVFAGVAGGVIGGLLGLIATGVRAPR